MIRYRCRHTPADHKTIDCAEREHGPLVIGDRSDDGLLEITDTNWNHDGVMFVTVRELIGGHAWAGGVPIAKMRRLARRALARPELTRSSKLVRTWYAEGCDHATFAISRHER